ncbi:purine-cytosine permease family protein [Solirubrobacter soli]|uniref:purine-cytosine permease family protein n=1 Tax=Solirubrobacter soli TaxID=363832 RepID=UPI00042426C8|nr:cytosine permease [Solirubrobacter soli]
MAIEARSIDWVPETERHGRIWHQAPLWFLGNFQYFSIPIGFIGPALGLSLEWSILAGVLGILTGTVFMAFHAAQGPTLGLPQMIQSRAQFGYRGVIVPLFATAFTYLAFNVADQVLLGEGLNGAFGWDANLVAIVCTVGAALLAIYGHDWVHKIFRILLYISFPLMTLVTLGIIFGKGGGGKPDEGGFVFAAFMAQFSAAAAYNITYAPYVSDYSRYLPKDTPNRSIIASVFFGASGSAIWLIALGAWLAVSLGASDGLVGLMTAGNNVIDGLGDLAAFFSAAALAATMGMNAYGGALTVLTAVDSVHTINPTRRLRVITIIGLAIVWFVIAKSISASAVSTVFTSLTLMLYLLVPWTATNLVDFFFVRRGHYAIADLFKVDGIYGAWGRRGLIAYGVGFLIEIPFMVLPDLGGWSYTGFMAKALNDVDIAWIVGLIVSGGVYWALTRSLDVESERRAEAISERELVAVS